MAIMCTGVWHYVCFMALSPKQLLVFIKIISQIKIKNTNRNCCEKFKSHNSMESRDQLAFERIHRYGNRSILLQNQLNFGLYRRFKVKNIK